MRNGQLLGIAYSFVPLIALPIILLSGMMWFVLVAVTMSGLPLNQALQPGVIEDGLEPNGCLERSGNFV